MSGWWQFLVWGTGTRAVGSEAKVDEGGAKRLPGSVIAANAGTWVATLASCLSAAVAAWKNCC